MFQFAIIMQTTAAMDDAATIFTLQSFDRLFDRAERWSLYLCVKDFHKLVVHRTWGEFALVYIGEIGGNLSNTSERVQ